MRKSKKGSLLGALKAHQAKSEIAARKKAQETAYAPSRSIDKKRKRSTATSGIPPDAAPSSVASTSAAVKKPTRRPTIPFHPSQQILLVGEGNFSFALSLLSTSSISVTPSLLIATSYDSEPECYRKYPDASSIVERLREAGAHVFFDVDATKIDRHKELKKLVLDTVAFNFPHVGAGIKDQDRNILVNQRLIVDFLQSIAPLLARGKDPSSTPGSRKRRKFDEDEEDEDARDDVTDLGSEDENENENENGIIGAGSVSAESRRIPPPTRGTVLITLRDAPPYTLWDVPRLAKSPPLSKPGSIATKALRKYKLVRSFQFQPDAYDGYEHRRTIGGSTGLKTNEDLMKGQGACRTWEFVLKDEEPAREYE